MTKVPIIVEIYFVEGVLYLLLYFNGSKCCLDEIISTSAGYLYRNVQYVHFV